MICARCDAPIQGTPRRIVVDSPTGAAPDIYVCPTPCQPSMPRQTAPERPFGR